MADILAPDRLYPEPRGVWWIKVWQVDTGRRVRFWEREEAEARQRVHGCQERGWVVEAVTGPDGEDLTRAWGEGW